MARAAGTRLGPYGLLAPLASGGFGDVYTARDTRLDRIIAIKILPSVDDVHRARTSADSTTSAARKRRSDLIREVLAWYDKYLGPLR